MPTRYLSAQYDVSTLTVDYAGSDGTHLLRTGGTIAWRFNNPGNIRPGRGNSLIMGAIGIGRTRGNGAFLIFASYAEGREQKRSLLRRKFNRRTIYTMLAGIPDNNGNLVEGYAPASDNNDPMAYARAISSHTGLPVTTVLSDISDAQMEQVLDAMEQKEGFHNLRETRRERTLHTTRVTVSDGARPRPNVPVQVRIGARTHDQATDRTGQLPPIAHTVPGERVEIHLPSADGLWKKELDFVMGAASSAYVLFNDFFSTSAPVAPTRPPPVAATPARQPIRYVIARGDTLGKLATRFSTSVASIRRHNPSIKNSNRIYQGQVIGIYGTPPAASGPAPRARPPAQPPARARRPAARAAEATRSRAGSGRPLAVVQADHRRAPWMTTALAEGRTFAGRHESVITRTRNYHREIAQGGTLVSLPWCASFVNFCLKEARYPFEPSRSSQFPSASRRFVRITRPVFGAIMVLRNYRASDNRFTGTGHVTFVYGQTADGQIAGLGGNQGQTVKLSDYATSGVSSRFALDGVRMEQRFHAFYIPATYAAFAEHEGELATVDVDGANRDLFGIERQASRQTGTR